MPQRCENYDAKGPDLKVNCANCKRWIGPQCADHLTMLSKYETSREFAALDKQMRSNKGVFLD